jgi:hypothetical protein
MQDPKTTGISRLIFFAGLITGLAFFIYYYMHQLTVAHYDAKAHLLVARRMFDSIEPGYAQMGVNWLPLIHLIYLPLVMIESQYRSGLFPSLISVLSFAISGWLSFRISHRLTGSIAAGIFAAAVLLANSNLEYLQSCPLTEPLYMMLLLLALDSITSWRISNPTGRPWLAALWVSLGALCRYEGWLIVSGVMLLLAVDFWTQYMPRRKVIQAGGIFLSFFLIPIAAHFGYIYLRLKSNFFMRVAEGNPDPFFTYNHPFFSIVSHISELTQIAAIIPLLLATAGLVILFIQKKEFTRRVPLVLLWMPSLINIAALYWGLIYRLRYSILLVPAVAIFGSLVIASAQASKRLLWLALITIMLLPWFSSHYSAAYLGINLIPGPGALWVPAIGLLLFLIAEAKQKYEWALLAICVLAMQLPLLEREHRPIMAETLEHEFIEPQRFQIMHYISQNYDGSRILIDMGRHAPLIYDSGLNVKEFVYNEGGEKLFHQALRQPAGVAGWVFFETGDALWKQLQIDPGWIDRYSLVMKTEYFFLYRLTK